jgi:hypothetical protein
MFIYGSQNLLLKTKSITPQIICSRISPKSITVSTGIKQTDVRVCAGFICETRGSHGSEVTDIVVLDCDAVWTPTDIPTSRWNTVSFYPWRRIQYVSPKRWYLNSRPNGVKAQKNIGIDTSGSGNKQVNTFIKLRVPQKVSLLDYDISSSRKTPLVTMKLQKSDWVKNPYKDDCLLGCCAQWPGKSLPTFHRCLFPPSYITHRPEDAGSKNFWNVVKLLTDYTMQHPKRQSCSYSPKLELDISAIMIQSNERTPQSQHARNCLLSPHLYGNFSDRSTQRVL